MVFTANDPPRPPSRPAALLWRLANGVLVFGSLGAGLGLLSGAVAYAAATGAVVGIFSGLINYWDFLRAQRFRGSFDPADLTLTRPDMAEAGTPLANPPALRRYRAPWYLQALAVLGIAGFTTIALLSSAAPDASALAVWFLWGMAVLSASFLCALVFTYTEVGPSGLRVRTPIKEKAINWPDLAEVRWHRDTTHDLLLFCTVDGAEIKSAGIAVADTGQGQRRVLRMLTHIREAWAWAARK